MSNLEREFWKCIIQNWQLCVVLNTRCRYFSMMCLKYPIFIKWFLPTRWYSIFLVLLYITSLIPCLNQNIKSSAMKSLVFLAEMIPWWLYISWKCTETCRCEKFYNLLYCLQNLTVFLQIKNSPNQLGTFVIISHGKGTMYLSMIFFFVWEFFTWKIVIMQEWKILSLFRN